MQASHIFVMRTGERLGGLASNRRLIRSRLLMAQLRLQSVTEDRKNVFISFFHDTAARTCVASQPSQNPLSFETQIRKLLSNYCPCVFFCSQLVYFDWILLKKKKKSRSLQANCLLYKRVGSLSGTLRDASGKWISRRFLSKSGLMKMSKLLTMWRLKVPLIMHPPPLQTHTHTHTRTHTHTSQKKSYLPHRCQQDAQTRTLSHTQTLLFSPFTQTCVFTDLEDKCGKSGNRSAL